YTWPFDFKNGMSVRQTPRKKKKILWGAFLILFGFSLIGGAWWISTRDIPQERIEDFIETEVQPELGKYSEKNKEASQRAIKRVKMAFRQYRLGVDPFVEDISSIKSRILLAWYGISDLKDKAFGDEKLQEQGEIEKFILARFSENIFSSQELNNLVSDTLEQFQDDIRANRNEFYQEVTLKWNNTGFSLLKLDFEDLVSRAEGIVLERSKKFATNSLIYGLLSIGGSEIVIKGLQVIMKPIGEWAVAKLSGLAAGKTITVAATALGTWAGPLGTVGGLVIGLTIDSFFSEKAEEKLKNSCYTLLSDMERIILYGSSDSLGLVKMLTTLIERIEEVEEQTIMASLMEVAK
ncbi:MAG: hypothetical protein ACP5EQ_07785, partial [Candidatus Cloacimonadia bacterium]